MELSLYSPTEYYEKQLREAHKTNSQKLFDDLAEKSRVNIEENRSTVAKYKSHTAQAQKLMRKIKKCKIWRVVLIVLSIIGLLCALGGALAVDMEGSSRAALIAIGGITAVLSLVLIFAKLNPTIKQAAVRYEEHSKKAAEYLVLAWEQMAALNDSFDDEMPLRLIEKTLPNISFDKRFTPGRLSDFQKNYAFEDHVDLKSSALDTVSGTFLKNPFLFERRLTETMGTCTYHGELLIHWTTYVRDKDGTRAVRHSQVLHAIVEKPKPYYKLDTVLNYGAQAAPDLKFSRVAAHIEKLTEKQIDKTVAKGEKKLAKRARDAMKRGGSFTEMANSEFDVLFGATDRDHEQQFRLLFTPLAQVEMLKLMRSGVGYGDDFEFIKRGRLNTIRSEHAAAWNMSTAASNFYSYDYDACRTRFVSYNEAYFKSVYFDFAPLVTIPAYQEEPVKSMEDVNESCHYTAKEYETMANKVGAGSFAHPDTATDVILKTARRHSRDGSDEVEVTAYSYAAEPRMDFVPTLGGDGKMHPVPVPWTEYIPIERVTVMDVCETDLSETAYDKARRRTTVTDANPAACYHGLYARSRGDDGNSVPDMKALLSQLLH